MVGVDTAPYERDLRGEVDVVGSGRRTRSDNWQPMGCVGSHRADHNVGSGGQLVKSFRLAGVGDDQRPLVGLVGQHLTQPIQSLGRPAGEPDAESGTCRAVQHDVEVTRRGVHGR